MQTRRMIQIFIVLVRVMEDGLPIRGPFILSLDKRLHEDTKQQRAFITYQWIGLKALVGEQYG